MLDPTLTITLTKMVLVIMVIFLYQHTTFDIGPLLNMTVVKEAHLNMFHWIKKTKRKQKLSTCSVLVSMAFKALNAVDEAPR